MLEEGLDAELKSFKEYVHGISGAVRLGEDNEEEIIRKLDSLLKYVTDEQGITFANVNDAQRVEDMLKQARISRRAEMDIEQYSNFERLEFKLELILDMYDALKEFKKANPYRNVVDSSDRYINQVRAAKTNLLMLIKNTEKGIDKKEQSLRQLQTELNELTTENLASEDGLLRINMVKDRFFDTLDLNEEEKLTIEQGISNVVNAKPATRFAKAVNGAKAFFSRESLRWGRIPLLLLGSVMVADVAFLGGSGTLATYALGTAVVVFGGVGLLGSVFAFFGANNLIKSVERGIIEREPVNVAKNSLVKVCTNIVKQRQIEATNLNEVTGADIDGAICDVAFKLLELTKPKLTGVQRFMRSIVDPIRGRSKIVYSERDIADKEQKVLDLVKSLERFLLQKGENNQFFDVVDPSGRLLIELNGAAFEYNREPNNDNQSKLNGALQEFHNLVGKKYYISDDPKHSNNYSIKSGDGYETTLLKLIEDGHLKDAQRQIDYFKSYKIELNPRVWNAVNSRGKTAFELLSEEGGREETKVLVNLFELNNNSFGGLSEAETFTIFKHILSDLPAANIQADKFDAILNFVARKLNERNILGLKDMMQPTISAFNIILSECKSSGAERRRYSRYIDSIVKLYAGNGLDSGASGSSYAQKMSDYIFFDSISNAKDVFWPHRGEQDASNIRLEKVCDTLNDQLVVLDNMSIEELTANLPETLKSSVDLALCRRYKALETLLVNNMPVAQEAVNLAVNSLHPIADVSAEQISLIRKFTDKRIFSKAKGKDALVALSTLRALAVKDSSPEIRTDSQFIYGKYLNFYATHPNFLNVCKDAESKDIANCIIDVLKSLARPVQPQMQVFMLKFGHQIPQDKLTEVLKVIDSKNLDHELDFFKVNLQPNRYPSYARAIEQNREADWVKLGLKDDNENKEADMLSNLVNEYISEHPLKLTDESMQGKLVSIDFKEIISMEVVRHPVFYLAGDCIRMMGRDNFKIQMTGEFASKGLCPKDRSPMIEIAPLTQSQILSQIEKIVRVKIKEIRDQGVGERAKLTNKT